MENKRKAEIIKETEQRIKIEIEKEKQFWALIEELEKTTTTTTTTTTATTTTTTTSTTTTTIATTTSTATSLTTSASTTVTTKMGTTSYFTTTVDNETTEMVPATTKRQLPAWFRASNIQENNVKSTSSPTTKGPSVTLPNGNLNYDYILDMMANSGNSDNQCMNFVKKVKTTIESKGNIQNWKKMVY